MMRAPRKGLMIAIVATSLLIGSAPAFAQHAVVPGHGRLQEIVELSATGNIFLPSTTPASGSQTLTLYTVAANQRLVVTDIWIQGSDSVAGASTFHGCGKVLRNGTVASGPCIPINGFYAISMLTGIEFTAGQTVGATFTVSTSPRAPGGFPCSPRSIFAGT